MKSKILLLAVTALVVLGAGCSWIKDKAGNTTIIPTGPKLADFKDAGPAVAAKKVNFVPGSQIEIRQTYLGVGAKEADAAAGDNKEGVRIITIERFAPMVYANLSWKLSRKIEAEMKTVKGNIKGFDLKSTHDIYLPAYWPSDDITGKSTSGIWLSEDAFTALVKSRMTSVAYGILNPDLYGAMGVAKDFADDIKSLQDVVNEAEKNDDLDLAKADADYTDWTLKINGQDVVVQVIKAHNWYGEMVVLNNPQNPLILKMTFNPLVSDAANLIKGGDFLSTLVGYEVTRLDNVQ
ncbi:MAG: hypothetical protein WC750_01310 [Patescibacteria group bacterium]|jgi:hypothetical protein